MTARTRAEHARRCAVRPPRHVTSLVRRSHAVFIAEPLFEPEIHTPTDHFARTTRIFSTLLEVMTGLAPALCVG